MRYSRAISDIICDMILFFQKNFEKVGVFYFWNTTGSVDSVRLTSEKVVSKRPGGADFQIQNSCVIRVCSAHDSGNTLEQKLASVHQKIRLSIASNRAKCTVPWYTTPTLNQRCARFFVAVVTNHDDVWSQPKIQVTQTHFFVLVCDHLILCAKLLVTPCDYFFLRLWPPVFCVWPFHNIFLRVWPPSDKHGHRHTFLCVTITCTITRTRLLSRRYTDISKQNLFNKSHTRWK